MAVDMVGSLELHGDRNNMIGSIKILNGFATQLPGFYPGRTFEFGEGVHALFGSNGSGKSSVLKMIKAYSAVEKGGWSRIGDIVALGVTHQNQFPYAYRTYSPGQSDCVVDWDGSPSFYNDGDVKIDQWAWFSNNSILSEDGMTTEEEQMQFLIDKPSSGQYRMTKLNKLLNLAENPPDLTKYVSGHPAQTAESNYIRTLLRNGKPTLILDEPERALSLPKQLELFKLLVSLTDRYQIIIATHSPFVLYEPGIKIHQIQEGYAEECLNIIQNCVSNIQEPQLNL